MKSIKSIKKGDKFLFKSDIIEFIGSKFIGGKADFKSINGIIYLSKIEVEKLNRIKDNSGQENI